MCGVAFDKVGTNFKRLIACYGLERENIKSGREKDRQNEAESTTVGFDHNAEHGKDDGEEGGDDGGQLRALSERCSDEERPARYDETEEHMYEEHDQDACLDKNTEFPDETE